MHILPVSRPAHPYWQVPSKRCIRVRGLGGHRSKSLGGHETVAQRSSAQHMGHAAISVS